MGLPRIATGLPHGGRLRRRFRRFTVHHGGHCGAERNPAMKTKLDADNSELERDFEPLRVLLALGALVLGVLFSLH